jgi:murein DD-endopeptidase MepM/ murein hydrolase activator NlpD
MVAVIGLGFACSAETGPDSALAIVVMPQPPLIEVRDGQQLLNFDFVVRNAGKSTLRLTEIEVSAYDSEKQLVLRKTVNSNGLSPSVDIVAKPTLGSGEIVDVFNPFYSFAETMPLERLEYAFRYVREDDAHEREANRHRLPMDFDVEVHTTVIPQPYSTKTDLILPLTGRLFVWEGHDFYAHHRRVPLNAPKVLGMGLSANSNRYAFDFEVVDAQGRMYHDDPYKKENYYCYGAFVYAPGAGKVIAAANDIPDNRYEGKKIISPDLPATADPKGLGNYVLIDHGDGEYSVLNHLMPGSVVVKPGDPVHQGQMVGKIGFTGDTIFPHLHYSLISGPEVFKVEGLPAYFNHYRRFTGEKSLEMKRGSVDSGDILQSTAEYLKTDVRKP